MEATSPDGTIACSLISDRVVGFVVVGSVEDFAANWLVAPPVNVCMVLPR